MRILFNGLGPYGTITHNNRYYKQGAVVDMEENAARAYIELGLATDCIEDEEKVKASAAKNEALTKRIVAKARAVEEGAE